MAHRDEFLGLDPSVKLGRGPAPLGALRDRTRPGWFTDEDRPDQNNVRLGADGKVVWAEIG